MNIGDLFLNLGIKGSEKTLGALGNVQKNLKSTASMSLEAKAGILGAMYALERLFAASGQQATALTNLSTYLGVSTKTLQQYRYAAQQVGVSNEEMDSTFKSLQATMAKTAMNGEAPKGLALISQLTGGALNSENILEFTKKPEELLKVLQSAAKNAEAMGMNTAVINEAMSSFGIGPNMVAGMRRNAFRPEVLNNAPILNEKQIAANDKNNIAWKNLGTHIENAIAKFNAAHGGQLVKDITMITDKAIKLAESFQKMSEKLELFKLLGMVFEGWGKIFDTIIMGVGMLNEYSKSQAENKRSEELKKDLTPGDYKFNIAGKKDVPNYFEVGKDQPIDWNKFLDNIRGLFSGEPGSPGIAPTAPSIASPTNGATQNINVNQVLNFQHDGRDANKTGESVKKAARDFFSQNPARAQVN